MDWLITKTGMLVAFFLLLGVMYGAYDIYDRHSAKGEVEAVASTISDQIAFVTATAPEYSTRKRIDLPEYIHGEPYIFTLDNESYNVKIRLIGKFSGEDISDFAMLPEFPVEIKGFNSKGEVSVGNTYEGMNTSSAIIVTKNEGHCAITAVK